MGLFSRRGKRAEQAATDDALSQWVGQRHGVEVFVEPKTAVTGTSMLLVAHDGEFTRKLVESPKAAESFARSHALPVYDATMVGYPQRMRDYSRRQTLLRRRAEREELGGT